MTTKLIQIGNSKGVRIPAKTLEECGIIEDILIETFDNLIVIRPIKKSPRTEWNKQFKRMNQDKEDSLIIEDSLDLNNYEWEW